MSSDYITHDIVYFESNFRHSLGMVFRACIKSQRFLTRFPVTSAYHTIGLALVCLSLVESFLPTRACIFHRLPFKDCFASLTYFCFPIQLVSTILIVYNPKYSGGFDLKKPTMFFGHAGNRAPIGRRWNFLKLYCIDLDLLIEKSILGRTLIFLGINCVSGATTPRDITG